MLLNSLYYAVAASFLFGLPFYKTLIKSRLNRTKIDEGKGEIELAKLCEKYGDKVKYEHKGGGRYEVIMITEQNFFNRKPFTCLLCMTFWLMVARSLVILFTSDFALADHAPLLGAPMLAEAFSRWFKSLPISI